jgi:hypothetical protein
MGRPPPPNLTEDDARVSLSWPAYATLKRRPTWALALGLAGGLGLLCWLSGFCSGLILH